MFISTPFITPRSDAVAYSWGYKVILNWYDVVTIMVKFKISSKMITT